MRRSDRRRKTRRVSNFVESTKGYEPAIDKKGEPIKTLQLDIHAVTWNVGASFPSVREIELALEADMGRKDKNRRQGPPDIFCIGLQEVVNLNVANIAFLPNHSSLPWERAIEGAINNIPNKNNKHGSGYTKICVQQLVGIVLLVYVRSDLFPYIAEFQTDQLGVGGVVRLGNKGAVAFRFKLFDCVFVIVNSHFTSGITKVSRRNRDYEDIQRNLCFLDEGCYSRTIFDCDILLFMGDFNYRLEYSAISQFDEVMDLIKKKKYSTLYEKDQLRIAKASEANVFNNLTEAGPINFPPSYKRIRHHYTAFSSKRTPSYTDRIFFKTRNPDAVVHRSSTKPPPTFDQDPMPLQSVFSQSSQSQSPIAGSVGTPPVSLRSVMETSEGKYSYPYSLRNDEEKHRDDLEQREEKHPSSKQTGYFTTSQSNMGAKTSEKIHPNLVKMANIEELEDEFSGSDESVVANDGKISRLTRLIPVCYSSKQDCTHSDHRPVIAYFEAHVMDPHAVGHEETTAEKNGGEGALMLWNIVGISQFFVMLLELNFKYTDNLYSILNFNYTLGWSTGIFKSDYLHEEHNRPDQSHVRELNGIERLSWESGIDPNYLPIQVLITFGAVLLRRLFCY